MLHCSHPSVTHFHLQDFWVDLNLVFDNAKKYNPAGSDCFLMAQTLQVGLIACYPPASFSVHACLKLSLRRVQEVAMERYEKTVAPRVSEEERALQLEEQGMQRRRAAAEDAADSAAVEQQCGKILALVDVSDVSGGLRMVGGRC